MHGVVSAIFYLLHSGCQWRLLPKTFRRIRRCTTTSKAGGARRRRWSGSRLSLRRVPHARGNEPLIPNLRKLILYTDLIPWG